MSDKNEQGMMVNAEAYKRYLANLTCPLCEYEKRVAEESQDEMAHYDPKDNGNQGS